MTTATRKPLRGRALWEKLVREQEEWITEHGGSLAGYVENYAGRHGQSTESATAIYEADTAALAEYKRRLAACRR
jgi:hypothetical protein